MNQHVRARGGRRIVLLWIAMAVLALACGQTEPDIPASASPEPTTISTTAPTEQAPTEPATEEQLPTWKDLTADGPWWLISTEQGHWALNVDGTGLTKLAQDGFYGPAGMEPVVASSGGLVAYISARDLNDMHGFTLHLLRLPSGDEQAIVELSTRYDDLEIQPGDPEFEAVRAFIDLPSAAWSPDDSLLAFMGVMDGPTSDLYVYRLIDGSIRRLTDGPSQGIRPTWSLDGREIVHQGVTTLGTGAGYGMAGIWSASADGTSIRSLYAIPQGSGDEEVVGWVGPMKFVVRSWNAGCGSYDLRTFDLQSSAVEVLWAGAFEQMALDWDSGSVLLAARDYSGFCEQQEGEGTYLIRPGVASPLKLSDVAADQVSWVSQSQVFLIWLDGALVGVSLDGDQTPMPAPVDTVPTVSPDRARWAFRGARFQVDQGLWVGTYGDMAQRVYSGSAFQVVWGSPTSLIFRGDGQLYVALGPDYTPVPIDLGSELGPNVNIGLVRP